MTSLAQIKANQENAQKSTGPKTEMGKKRSSQNALTHGIFAQIPILPGEDKDSMMALADAINNTFKPQDAMELMLVERIIIASIRQIRLREAEAANVRISMTPKNIANSLSQALKMSFTEQLTPEDLTPEVEAVYQSCVDALKEIEASDYLNTPVTEEMIRETMPITFEYLIGKPKEYRVDWDKFFENEDMIRKAINEVKFDFEKYMRIGNGKHTAYLLFDDMKALHRIPQMKDMALFSKYQVQFDTDLYRAMNALEKYRNSKAKIIEGEVVNELSA
jgi:hypothetical protein